jgi:hypothetical protein
VNDVHHDLNAIGRCAHKRPRAETQPLRSRPLELSLSYTEFRTAFQQPHVHLHRAAFSLPRRFSGCRTGCSCTGRFACSSSGHKTSSVDVFSQGVDAVMTAQNYANSSISKSRKYRAVVA